MRISDWSSDVCSSDLPQESPLHVLGVITRAHFLVMRQLRTGQELDCLGGARNCPAVAEDLGLIHSRLTLLSHSGGHVTRFLERVPQFLHVMRAGNRNDRRPTESPHNRDIFTSGGGVVGRAPWREGVAM